MCHLYCHSCNRGFFFFFLARLITQKCSYPPESTALPSHKNLTCYVASEDPYSRKISCPLRVRMFDSDSAMVLRVETGTCSSDCIYTYQSHHYTTYDRDAKFRCFGFEVRFLWTSGVLQLPRVRLVRRAREKGVFGQSSNVLSIPRYISSWRLLQGSPRL